jgi:hypothetical protein
MSNLRTSFVLLAAALAAVGSLGCGSGSGSMSDGAYKVRGSGRTHSSTSKAGATIFIVSDEAWGTVMLDAQGNPLADPPTATIHATGFAVPESAVHDVSSDVYLVSNIRGAPPRQGRRRLYLTGQSGRRRRGPQADRRER